MLLLLNVKKNVSLHVADLRSNKPDVPHVYIPEMEDTIKILGARVHNHKNVDLERSLYQLLVRAYSSFAAGSTYLLTGKK